MTEPQTTQKKGLGPLAWIAIGCGGLILIAFLVMSVAIWFGARKAKDWAQDFEEDPAKAAAEMLVKVNPELEMVESDENEGTITIRVKETGEVATFDYSEIQEGKLSLESSEGRIAFDATSEDEGAIFTLETDEGTTQFGTLGEPGELPDWLPTYPNAENAQTGFSEDKAGSRSGSFQFETTDSPEEVFRRYREGFEAAGLSVQETTTTQDGTIQGGSLSAKEESGVRQSSVTIVSAGEKTRVSIFFAEAQ